VKLPGFAECGILLMKPEATAGDSLCSVCCIGNLQSAATSCWEAGNAFCSCATTLNTPADTSSVLLCRSFYTARSIPTPAMFTLLTL
jgi:hypothetical protein